MHLNPPRAQKTRPAELRLLVMIAQNGQTFWQQKAFDALANPARVGIF